MADRAVHAKRHNLASGTGTAAVETAKGTARGIFNWGRAGVVLGLAASAALGFGVAAALPGAIGLLSGTVGAVAGLLSTAVTVPFATMGLAQVGALFGGVNGASKGVDRVGAEHTAYKEAKSAEYAMGMQAQQAEVQSQALQNLMVAQAMQEQAMQAGAVPSTRVAGAQRATGTELEPSQHMKDTVPGMAEAANDNKDVAALLEQISEASHGDKVHTEQALAADAEATR